MELLPREEIKEKGEEKELNRENHYSKKQRAF